MNKLLEYLGAGALGVVGCALYVAFYAIMLALTVGLGIIILKWIF